MIAIVIELLVLAACFYGAIRLKTFGAWLIAVAQLMRFLSFINFLTAASVMHENPSENANNFTAFIGYGNILRNTAHVIFVIGFVLLTHKVLKWKGELSA